MTYYPWNHQGRLIPMRCGSHKVRRDLAPGTTEHWCQQCHKWHTLELRLSSTGRTLMAIWDAEVPVS